MAEAQRFGRQLDDSCKLRIIGPDGNDVAGESGEIYFLPNDGPGCTYHYLGAEPEAAIVTGQSNRRGIGWEYVHACIDGHSRVAFSQILPNEKVGSAVAFVMAAVAYYKSLGVTVTRVMTDNGSC